MLKLKEMIEIAGKEYITVSSNGYEQPNCLIRILHGTPYAGMMVPCALHVDCIHHNQIHRVVIPEIFSLQPANNGVFESKLQGIYYNSMVIIIFDTAIFDSVKMKMAEISSATFVLNILRLGDYLISNIFLVEWKD